MAARASRPRSGRRLLRVSGPGAVGAGVGVNLDGRTSSLPEEIRDRATMFQAVYGRHPTPDELAETICERFAAWLLCHAKEGLTPVLEAWRRRSSTLGERVRVTLGAQVVEREWPSTSRTTVRSSSRSRAGRSPSRRAK